MKSWLLLDRDDTILDDPGYLSDPKKVKFLPGALDGLRRFHELGWPLVVITNQSGIGRGYYGLAELDAVHQEFRNQLCAAGVELAGIYFCPHTPDEGCSCRKPETELAERAARDLNLNLSDSVMVGDKLSDLQLGKRIESEFVAQIVVKGKAALDQADGHFSSLDELADQLLEA